MRRRDMTCCDDCTATKARLESRWPLRWTQERSCDSSTGRFEAVLPGNFTITFAPNLNVYLYRDDEEVFEQDAPEEDDIAIALAWLACYRMHTAYAGKPTHAP